MEYTQYFRRKSLELNIILIGLVLLYLLLDVNLFPNHSRGFAIAPAALLLIAINVVYTVYTLIIKKGAKEGQFVRLYRYYLFISTLLMILLLSYFLFADWLV